MDTNSFIEAFIFELELSLNKNVQIFENIKFYSDEANTDREVKAAIKKFILENHKGIFTVQKVTFGVEENDITFEPQDFEILDVLVTDDISYTDKTTLKNDSAVYTNPDLLLKFSYNGEEFEESIEVKSTKNDAIPGSSVQQVSANDFVIFIKHDKVRVEITAGKYVNAIIVEQCSFPIGLRGLKCLLTH